MAQMIPESPAMRSKGEERTFKILKKLPDDCIVYYEPVIEGRYPDFIVIIPSLGVLIIEVKGWYPNTIEKINDLEVKVSGKIEKHPLMQAREYMLNLMDSCRNSVFGSVLIGKSGRLKNKFIMPFVTVAILSNINKKDFDEDIIKFFPRTMFRDALVKFSDNIDSISSEGCLKLFSSFFDAQHKWPVNLNIDQVNTLRGIIHPEIVITPPEVKSRNKNNNNDFDIVPKVLDPEQERNAKKIKSGHRLLFGVAGSGKTVILIARAKILARKYPERKILVTCYNVALANYLKECLKGYKVDVMNFHKLANKAWNMKFKVNENAYKSDEDFGDEILKRIEIIPEADQIKYDSILIDEVQDFDPTWIKCILKLFNDPDNGDLLIVGDGKQGIYSRGGKRKIVWKNLGVHALSRTQYLKICYRNSFEIIKFASAISELIQTDDENFKNIVADLNTATRKTGFKPLLITDSTQKNIKEKFINIIKNLLDGKFNGNELPRKLLPEEIAVLCPFNNMIKELSDEIKNFANVVTDKSSLMSDGIKLLTLHSSKGLQFKAVLIYCVDSLERNKNITSDEAINLLYVGITRAEDILIIGCADKFKKLNITAELNKTLEAELIESIN